MCGSEHDVSEHEIAYALPDDYFALPPEERDRRGMANDDLCVQEAASSSEPFSDSIPEEGREYCWGLWAEVSPEAFKWYLDWYSVDRQAEVPAFAGRLANELAGYESTKGLAVSVQLTGATTRPRLTLTNLQHQLSQEQRNGVTPQRLLEFLAPYLHEADGEFGSSQGKRRRSARRGKRLKARASKQSSRRQRSAVANTIVPGRPVNRERVHERIVERREALRPPGRRVHPECRKARSVHLDVSRTLRSQEGRCSGWRPLR